jgi:ATP-dependent Clp protease ATP-binding subunit ClpB
MTARWQVEKEEIQAFGLLKEQLEQARIEEQQAEREGDLSRVAEIRYGRIRELEQKIEEAEKKAEAGENANRMLKEEVDEADVARIVAKWTRIPVTKMLESEVQKLLHMEELLRGRVVGQSEGLTAVSDASRRSRAGLQDTDRPIGVFMFMGPTGVGMTLLASTYTTSLCSHKD